MVSQARVMHYKIDCSKISNISRTYLQNLNVSYPVLQSAMPNPLKPGIKLIMKM